MQINLELYRVFGAVAANGSFSEAARALFLTQSAVSQSIAQLERLLDRRLFTRGRRGVTLTPEGAVLYDHIGPALAAIANGEDRLERMRHLQAGELSIGAGDTISEHYLLPFLERFHGLYPEIRLNVSNRTSVQLVNQLRAGAVDLAFANLPLDEPDLDVTECLTVHDVFVASHKYAQLAGRALEAQELASCHLIMLETLSNSRRYVDAFFQARGVRLKPEIELGAHDLLLEFARIGLGISCVVEEFSSDYLGNGLLFPLLLKTPVPPRSIGLCALAGAPRSFAAEAFTRLLFGDTPCA